VTNFHIGQKVVCLKTWKLKIDPHEPIEGIVYTIRDIQLIGPKIGLRFIELRNPPRRYAEGPGLLESLFNSEWFRPVAEIEQFRKLVADVRHPVLAK
jgi:hypothetical protein